MQRRALWCVYVLHVACAGDRMWDTLRWSARVCRVAWGRKIHVVSRRGRIIRSAADCGYFRGRGADPTAIICGLMCRQYG